MKRNKFVIVSVTFLTGVVFGISLISVLSFVRPDNPPSPPQDITVIDTTAANRYFNNYFRSAGALPAPVKGFLVDQLQLEAMNNLLNYDRTLTGFRLIMGKDDNGQNIGIVVGVNGRLSDATFGRIYKTASVSSGTCPFICDENSPITRISK